MKCPRWLCVRIELLGNTFTATLAAYLLYGPQKGASNTGFLLNMAGTFFPSYSFLSADAFPSRLYRNYLMVGPYIQ